MTLPNPLQQLYDLKKSPPWFYNQLRSIISGEEYRERVPQLRDDDLVRLVEYLDGVSLQIALPHSLFTVIVGS